MEGIADQDQFVVHYKMFKITKIQVRNTVASAKSEYYNKKIKASRGNQRTVFSVVNIVLYKSEIVLSNIINSDKIWLFVLITSSVKRY